jgi:excisionase family DNA binding protein
VEGALKREAQRQRRLLRTREAGLYLGISDWSVRQLVIKGLLPYLQLGRNTPFLLDQRDLDAWVEREKTIRDSR